MTDKLSRDNVWLYHPGSGTTISLAEDLILFKVLVGDEAEDEPEPDETNTLHDDAGDLIFAALMLANK